MVRIECNIICNISSRNHNLKNIKFDKFPEIKNAIDVNFIFEYHFVAFICIKWGKEEGSWLKWRKKSALVTWASEYRRLISLITPGCPWCDVRRLQVVMIAINHTLRAIMTRIITLCHDQETQCRAHTHQRPLLSTSQDTFNCKILNQDVYGRSGTVAFCNRNCLIMAKVPC